MANSPYLTAYINGAKLEEKRAGNPKWMSRFFREFAVELENQYKNAGPGNRNLIPSALKEAFKHQFFPQEIQITHEKIVSEYIPKGTNGDVIELLAKKRLDFEFVGKCGIVLVEFKTNFQFNDYAAAMIEMGSIKKYSLKNENNYCITNNGKIITTASLHLFPYLTNVNGLIALNRDMDSPIDKTWILCDKNQKFNLEEVKKFRNDVISAVM